MGRRNKSSRSKRSEDETPAEDPSALEKATTLLKHAAASFWAKPWYYRVAAVMTLVALVLLFQEGESQSATNYYEIDPQTQSAWRRGFSLRTKGGDSNSLVSLVSGELPGYTGWARPATSLAGNFHLDPSFDISSEVATAGEKWVFTIQCSHPECAQGGALFFVRAYGPSVVTGIVNDQKDGSYQIDLLFKDPGPYTLEVVLTFSNPPSIGKFPLPPDQSQPAYEGYLLPEFPLPLEVVPNPEKDYTYTKSKSLPVCEMEELFETDAHSAWEKARWVVTDKVNSPHHVDDGHHKEVTLAGYQNNHNSLGIQMEYHHDDCRILPTVHPQHPANPLNQCTQDEGPLHFVFVGDSNMRLQRNLFEIAFLGLEEHDREKSRYNEHRIRASYVDLTGGALKCNFEGGDHNVTRFFQMIKAREDASLDKPERHVVLFNTGMHDIHRLCSQEYQADRLTYLGPEATDTSQNFHCVMHYRYAVEGLATEILNWNDASLRVFQSTTAGWPKYGNYGVVWPTEGTQNMPVSTEFIDFFNEIAFDVFKDSFPTIPVMDGYWVSYARPDNREVSQRVKKTLENKLSHPGMEVVMTLLRTWVTIVAQSDVCKKE